VYKELYSVYTYIYLNIIVYIHIIHNINKKDEILEITAEDIIYKLYTLYKVDNNIELASKINTTPQTISNWKTRNAMSAIKKKCRELGIYNEIFGDLNSNTIIQGKKSRAAGRDYSENKSSESDNAPQLDFDDLTISLIKKYIEQHGEDELQFKLMDLLRNA